MFDATVKGLVSEALERSVHLFDLFYEMRLVSSTIECRALLVALRKHKRHKTMPLFMEHMRQRKIKPDEVTYVLLMTACGALSDLKQAERVTLLN